MNYGEKNSCSERGYCRHWNAGYCNLLQMKTEQKCEHYESRIAIELSDVSSFIPSFLFQNEDENN